MTLVELRWLVIDEAQNRSVLQYRTGRIDVDSWRTPPIIWGGWTDVPYVTEKPNDR
jgi:hypothetical protein